jgi:DNA-binding transcriptional ArsR family regulator
VTCQGTSSWREHSEQGWLMNRIARGCASKPGGFAGYLGNWPASPRQREVLRSSRARGRKVAVLARAVEEEHAAVLALLADGESWSSSSLADALGASQRTVQRALASLAAAGKVQSLGRARARRWITPPVPDSRRSCYSPHHCRATRMEAQPPRSSVRKGPFRVDGSMAFSLSPHADQTC